MMLLDMDLYRKSTFLAVVLSIVFSTSTMAIQSIPAMQALEQMRSLKENSAGEVRRVMKDAVAGVSYPTLNEIPRTTFSCDQVGQPGFYADQQAYCQVYRRCDFDGGMSSFMCPNRTLFNQITLICDWWFNVICDKATSFYSYSNSRLFNFNGKFLEDAATSPAPKFDRQRDNLPVSFQSLRKIANSRLEEDSLGSIDDQEVAAVASNSDPQTGLGRSATVRLLGPQRPPLPSTTEPTAVSTHFEPAAANFSRTSASGDHLFFASERFALPLFEAPPTTTKSNPQDDHIQSSDSMSESPGWSLPVFNPELGPEMGILAAAGFETTTAPSSTAHSSANLNSLIMPKSTLRPFRVLRPNHATKINPSFFPT